MKKIFTLLFTFLTSITFITAQCDHIFRMNDAFGDGWNGATVDIVVGTTTVVSGATITAGATGDQLFSASTGDAISLANWVSGAWDSEVSWEILDGTGAVIATGIHGDVTVGSGNCPPPPVCDHIFRMTDAFGDGWNGATVDIVVGTTTVVTAATITAGATGDQVFSASTGDAISLANWVSGAWDSEVSWELLDGGGAVIASGLHGD
ncbi:MAG: hypothetical protein VX756_04025, partial [Bacteroidota bacterium]|nr:hypothetical protein [Bacteroidota bacterium]